MGNPLRFLGAGHEIQLGDITIPPRCAVEVTFRTHQQRLLLRPDEDATDVILGCFGRAYHRYPELNLNVLSVLSNHGCFVALPESAHVMSNFMRDFLSTAAKRLNLHRDREGTFWERRYRAIPIVDEASLEDRFRYVLTQGTKEDLVWSARDWPGVSSARALLGGPGLVGRWRDRSAEGALRRQRERKIQRAQARGCTLDLPRAPQVWREYPIDLVPLPHWRDLKVGQRRARVAAMLHQDDEATRARHERAGTRPLGLRGLFAASPFDRPAKPAKSPAPRCHASSRARRDAFRVVYRAFADRLQASRDTVSTGLAAARVPLHGTLPPLGHHPTLLPRRPDLPLAVGQPGKPATGAVGVGPPVLEDLA